MHKRQICDLFHNILAKSFISVFSRVIGQLLSILHPLTGSFLTSVTIPSLIDLGILLFCCKLAYSPYSRCPNNSRIVRAYATICHYLNHLLRRDRPFTAFHIPHVHSVAIHIITEDCNPMSVKCDVIPSLPTTGRRNNPDHGCVYRK